MKISQISRKTLRSKLCKGLLITMTLSLLGGSALAGPGDGTVGDTTKIVNNGPASDRFNLVLLGDVSTWSPTKAALTTRPVRTPTSA
jgi:hypothetical protein